MRHEKQFKEENGDVWKVSVRLDTDTSRSFYDWFVSAGIKIKGKLSFDYSITSDCPPEYIRQTKQELLDKIKID